MAVVRKIACTVACVTEHGRGVYTLELTPAGPVPRFKPGQFLHLALDAYRAGWLLARVQSVLDRELPARAGSPAAYVRRQRAVHGEDGARAGSRR